MRIKTIRLNYLNTMENIKAKFILTSKNFTFRFALIFTPNTFITITNRKFLRKLLFKY